ncbi:MAG: nitroreductase/quinone reductase family protein, partial [Gammaproteobacteria bacterium]|nr:nitroreductase/quinone reductase family protein [Gammaproteobacteria bacterium]
KGGAPKHPGWYHNLKAQGEVTVQVAKDIFQANARTAESEERAAIWKQMTALYPPYDEYQGKAGDREIPVIVLERIG